LLLLLLLLLLLACLLRLAADAAVAIAAADPKDAAAILPKAQHSRLPGVLGAAVPRCEQCMPLLMPAPMSKAICAPPAKQPNAVPDLSEYSVLPPPTLVPNLCRVQYPLKCIAEEGAAAPAAPNTNCPSTCHWMSSRGMQHAYMPVCRARPVSSTTRSKRRGGCAGRWTTDQATWEPRPLPGGAAWRPAPCCRRAPAD
jgi:hypothetical protein